MNFVLECQQLKIIENPNDLSYIIILKCRGGDSKSFKFVLRYQHFPLHFTFLSDFTFLSTFLSKFTFLSTFLSGVTFLSTFLSTFLGLLVTQNLYGTSVTTATKCSVIMWL